MIISNDSETSELLSDSKHDFRTSALARIVINWGSDHSEE